VQQGFRNFELCKIAVSQNGFSIKDVPKELYKNSDELLRLAVQ